MIARSRTTSLDFTDLEGMGKKVKRDFKASELVHAVEITKEHPPIKLGSDASVTSAIKLKNASSLSVHSYLESLGLDEKWLKRVVHRYRIIDFDGGSKRTIAINENIPSLRFFQTLTGAMFVLSAVAILLTLSLPLSYYSVTPLLFCLALGSVLVHFIYERGILYLDALDILEQKAPWLFHTAE